MVDVWVGSETGLLKGWKEKTGIFDNKQMLGWRNLEVFPLHCKLFFLCLVPTSQGLILTRVPSRITVWQRKQSVKMEYVL